MIWLQAWHLILNKVFYVGIEDISGTEFRVKRLWIIVTLWISSFEDFFYPALQWSSYSRSTAQQTLFTEYNICLQLPAKNSVQRPASKWFSVGPSTITLVESPKQPLGYHLSSKENYQHPLWHHKGLFPEIQVFTFTYFEKTSVKQVGPFLWNRI